MRDLRLSTTVLESISLNFSKLPLNSVCSLPSGAKSLILEYFVAKDCLTEAHLEVLLDEYQEILDFSNCSHISDRAFDLVSSRCPRLKSIRFANCPQVTTRGLEKLYGRFSIANSLDLSGTHGILSSRTVQTMSRNCRSLTHLLLEDCHDLKDKVVNELFTSVGGFLQRVSFARSDCNDAWLRSLASHSPELRYLNLAECKLPTAMGVGHVIFQCRQLEELNLSDLRCFSETDLLGLVHALPATLCRLNLSFVHAATDAILSVLVKKCPALTKLSLRGLFHLKGTFLPLLLTRCPQLLKLRLDLCKDIQEHHLFPLISPVTRRVGVRRERQPQLTLNVRELNLSGVKSLSDKGLRTLATLCPLLECVNLSGLRYISNEGILALAAGCPKLSRVNLSLCAQLTDEALVPLVQRTGQQLRYLTLHCTGAWEGTLEAIAEHCSGLIVLSLFGMRGVNETLVSRAAAANPGLRHLDVSNIATMSDTSLATIALACPNLASFYAIACANVTDAGVSHLVRNCPDLAWLNLNGCVRITNDLLALMARASRYMTYFSLSGCNNISDAGFLLIGRGCPMLKSLTICASSAVSSNAIKLLQHDRPNLRVVFN